MPTKFVEGRKVFFVRRDPVPVMGPPVVYVHGAGGSHQHWLRQVRGLPRSPTYAIDLPGHGRSEGPGRDSIASYVDWLLGFLDASEVDQPAVVGHSMGGAIALHMALHHPDRVAGLGLVATGGRLRVAPQILEGIHQDFQATVRLICGWAFGPESAPEMVRLGIRQMSATPADVLLGDFDACDHFDVMDRLAEIKTPAVIICGTRDRMTPIKYSTTLRDRLSGSVLRLVEGAGHMVMVENPVAVAHALSSLVDRL